MTAVVAELTYEAFVVQRAEAVLERARNPLVYQGHMRVITAMSVLEAALKGSAAEAVNGATGNLVRAVRNAHDDDMAAYVGGTEGER